MADGTTPGAGYAVVEAKQGKAPVPWPMPDMTLATAQAAPAPALPLGNVFPGGWAEWVSEAAEAAGAPPDYVAGALLSAGGSLIGNARWANPWGEWREPPALKVALIGRPSSNKSPGLDALVGPLNELEAAENADHAERRREWQTLATAAALRREAWQRDVKDAVKAGHAPPRMPAEAEEPTAPQRRRLVSTDPTVEKAARLSAANPRGLLLVRDELAGWMAGMDRYGAGGGGSDRAFWLQAYGGRPWTPDRVKDGDTEVSVPHLLWGIVGGIQPDRLASTLLTGDDDGLAARFLYAWPEPRKPVRPRPTPGLARGRAWMARLRALPWQPPEPVVLPFTEGARAALQDWREQAAGMEDGAAGLFLSWLGKLPGFAVRLALVLEHLAWAAEPEGREPPEAVGEVALLRAVLFLDEYAVPMARRAFGEAALPQAERDARQLARWLLKQHPRPEVVNVRVLRRMAGGPGIAGAPRLRAALDELAALGWVRPAPAREGETAGRARDDWAINPALAGATRDVA